ncbi:SGNH/GDSL hydrolase family protein [Staphylococcus pseudintermedius]|uniref:SGNH/GDSL hydrolase family protein n=1 Tax=Staphylococcus pseudintermedius TaxID=283734 RepID=UPI001124733A|nr:SGNH/GDSL hydrolase family protein [Staphylococcus pseudintermedius]EGQ0321093.1 SGNH/GDSL hydrolase family protein [Staphylococcus pseudintermedius]EGQ3788182.1 SGNH/GDSL hydrolase family protein [Staphylococcus pseudintermedius]EGQ4212648.1 SGNH/GDSL hydrolase family protein [Staphylococcus pseudintermedius]EHT3704383.1 SGNH/GDSL hydrolase family protein [Staphylococcus pseudintermedius]EJF1318636.1 SGNH/GDSL hydrolase family protein [Staphylococcus pseudintermedius]
MKLKLSNVFRDFKKDVESNFKEIDKLLTELIDIKSKTSNKYLDSLIDTLFTKRYDQLQKEIRAIVLPEMSPLAITEDYEKSLTDLKGVKHESLKKRIDSDMKYVESKSQKTSNDDRFIVTENGTVFADFLNKSKTIKSVKKIGVIGDSVAKGSRASKNFGKYLSEKLGATVQNEAVSGATMSTVKANSIYEQAAKIRGMDLVIIQGTDDDWLYNGSTGVQIGTSKTNEKTFYGAFCKTVELIKSNNPKAKILVMTATRQLPVNGTTIRRKDTDKNSLELDLEAYVNAQVLACSELNVPVFDAYHTDLLDPYNPAFRVKNMVDGLHPNEFGHEVIMHELLKNYYYFYG